MGIRLFSEIMGYLEGKDNSDLPKYVAIEQKPGAESNLTACSPQTAGVEAFVGIHCACLSLLWQPKTTYNRTGMGKWGSEWF